MFGKRKRMFGKNDRYTIIKNFDDQAKKIPNSKTCNYYTHDINAFEN